MPFTLNKPLPAQSLVSLLKMEIIIVPTAQGAHEEVMR